MNDKVLPVVPGGEFILYQTEDGRTKLEVRFRNETVWLSLNQMAALFQRDKSVVSRHIKNIFDEGELVRSAVVAESATTAADGKTYQVEFYNLDVRLPEPQSDLTRLVEETNNHFKGQKGRKRRKSDVSFVTSVPLVELAA